MSSVKKEPVKGALHCTVKFTALLSDTNKCGTEASLFGVPYWLPTAWGLGFVLITRFGMHLRRIDPRD